jgi:hypothetical protein
VERLCRACEEYAGLRLADAVNAIVDRVGSEGKKAADDVLLVGVEVPE